MNILNLRPKEFHIVGILLSMFFSISVASITGTTVRDAIFLIEFNKTYLSIMYVVIAIVITFIIEAYKKLITKNSHYVLMTTFNLFFIISLLLFHFNLDGWIIPLFYVWIEIVTVITILQFWMLCGNLLNTRQAKRIFPIITAGGSLAAISTGFLMKPFVKEYGTDNLILLTILSLLFTLFTLQILKPYLKGLNDKEFSKSKKTKGNNLSNSYLKYIAIMVACGAFITKVIDYQFKVMAANTFPEQNSLVSFFATYSIYTGAATLLMQSILTGFILTRFGILAGLLMLPTTIMFGSTGFLILGSISAVFILKFSDQVFKFSVNNSVKEILWLPVKTIKKNSAKPMIDGSLKSIIEGLSGVTIFLLVYFNLIPDTKIYLLSFIVIPFAFYWCWNSFKIKKGYLSEIISSIENRHLDLNEIVFDINDSNTIKALNSALESGDDFKKLFAINLLRDLPTFPFKENIRKQLYTGSPDIKKSILDLCWQKNDIITDEMILEQINLQDQTSAYFISCASDRSIDGLFDIIKPYLNDKNISIRASSLVSILSIEPNNIEAKKLINELLQNGNDKIRIEIFRFLKMSIYEVSDQMIIRFLGSANNELKNAVLKLIINEKKLSYLKPIIELLDNNLVASNAKAVLLQYDQQIVIKNLLKYLKREEIRNDLKVAIIHFSKNYPNKQILNMLIAYVPNSNLMIINASCNSLIEISKINPLEKNTLKLIEKNIKVLSQRAFQLHLFNDALNSEMKALLIIDQIDSDLKTIRHIILKLGTLKAPNIPIEKYLQYVDSQDSRLLPLVLELVDSTFSNQAIELIIPLIDPEINAVKFAPSLLENKILSKNDMLISWIKDSDHWKIHITIQYLIIKEKMNQLKMVDLNELYENCLYMNYFSNSEKRYLNKLQSNKSFKKQESNKMYSVLEKTLLLKSVDLFKNIPGAILSKIANVAEEIQIYSDDIIFMEGDHGDALYVIISGKISIIKHEKEIAVLEKGNCIGEMSLLDHEPRSAEAKANEDTILLKINQEEFYELMSYNPDITKQIVKILTRRLREMNKKIAKFS